METSLVLSPTAVKRPESDPWENIEKFCKVGHDVSARVVKIDRGERRIGLSIKAAAYSDEQLKEEQKILDALKPGEDLVALQHAFDALDDVKVTDKE